MLHFISSYLNLKETCNVAEVGMDKVPTQWHEGREELCIQGLVVQDLAPFMFPVSVSLEISFLNLSPTILVHLGFHLVIKALDPRIANF